MAARAGKAALAWACVAVVLFAVWLLLTDTREVPQLIAGVVVAAIAATGSELVRSQRVGNAGVRGRWLLRLWRPLVSVPGDILSLARAAALALRGGARRRPGRFRAIPFDPGQGDAHDTGREALAEIAGSFSPNTYVVGLDAEHRLLLVHQLVPDEERAEDAIDPLRLR